MCSGVTPQQPPMICAPSSRHASASSAYAAGSISSSKRQREPSMWPRFGYTPSGNCVKSREPGDHPGHVVDGQAVDHQRAHAHLLEAARGAAEEIALGRPPVLPEDTAHAVPAAPEGEPDRQPRLEQQLDRLEQLRIAHERQRLEQDQVGRLLGEHAGEQLERARGDLASSPPRRSRTRPRTRPHGRPPRSHVARAGCRAARCPSSAPPPLHPAPAAPRARVRTGSTRCPSTARCSPRRHSSCARRGRPAAPGRAPTCPRAAPGSPPGLGGAVAPFRRRRPGPRSAPQRASPRGGGRPKMARTSRGFAAPRPSRLTTPWRARAAAALRSASSA